MLTDTASATPAPEACIAELRAVLPAPAVIVDRESLRAYECDALSAYHQLPAVVLLPATLEELKAALAVCHKHGVAMVARGAGTGLSGGALPIAGGAVLSLAKFNRILRIDPLNRVAVVEPGVRNVSVSEAAAPHGLYFAPDPSSQIACTIGGNVAENSGGVHCLKYGLTVHNVLAMTLLTVDGQQLDLGGTALDAPGYDLLALATGSEGLLGVITSVTVRLLPRPTDVQVLLAAFASVEAAGTAVAEIIASGIVPAGLEMMDRLAIQAAEDFIHAGYPTTAEAMLLCELDGHPDEVAAHVAQVTRILEQQQALSIQQAADETQRRVLWAGRKAAFPAVGRIKPDYFCMDGTIPRKELAAVLTRIGELSKDYGLAVANVFHAGDGNLHPLILFDANAPGQLEKAEALGGAILELCVAVGGTVTGEHGVGIEKLNQMCVQFSTAELEQFFAVKAAFDPEGLLNPGKAIPTLRRCAELGRMHVHEGQLPFSELERY